MLRRQKGGLVAMPMRRAKPGISAIPLCFIFQQAKHNCCLKKIKFSPSRCCYNCLFLIICDLLFRRRSGNRQLLCHRRPGDRGGALGPTQTRCIRVCDLPGYPSHLNTPSTSKVRWPQPGSALLRVT